MQNMILDMTTTLGALLRRAREARGMTLEQVADMIGRPISWYSTIETGRKKGLPEPLEMRQIGDRLGLTMPDMLEAAGYLEPGDLTENRANPFDRDDPRYAFVEALKQLDLSDEYDAYVVVTSAQILRTMIAERETFRQDAITAMRALRASPKGTVAQE